MKTNIFKNVSLNDSLGSSPYISFKNGEKKKKRKKNSYTDKFIDKKKLSSKMAIAEKIQKQKRSITSSKINNDNSNLNESKKSGISSPNNKLKNISKSSNKQILNKNNSYQNYNIKFQFLPKNKKKLISSEDTNINKEKNKPENNTNNLNSNIILINNNNINYTNKETNEEKIKEGQNINIILNNKIQNINKNFSQNSYKPLNLKRNKLESIIVDNNRHLLTQEEIFQNEKVKSLLISNISDITNSISNLYTNTEQSGNNNKNSIQSKMNRSNSKNKNKINEYCFKNKNPCNIINNLPTENTYSKERIMTNYNNDFEINISDIKKTNINNENNYFFKSNFDNDITKENKRNKESKENEENTNTIINRLEYNKTNNEKKNKNFDVKNFNKLDNLIAKSKEEIHKINENNINDLQAKNITNKDYKIYEVNTFRLIPKQENSNNDNNKINENELYDKNKERNLKETNKNEGLNGIYYWNENEKEKNQNINFDEYINRAKEKLNQIRNNNNLNNTINNRIKIKSTFNYLLRQNDELNENYKSNENEKIINNNILNNIKGYNYSNNKCIIKRSNRMQNYLSNFKDNLNNKNNSKKNDKKENVNNNNIPNIKTIVDKSHLEYFDEDEFIQIKKRNLSSNKVNISNLNQDLKYLDKTLKLENINYYDNIGKKIISDENVLPPNNINYKEIFSKTLLNNFIKK